MKDGSGGDLDLGTEYSTQLFSPMFYFMVLGLCPIKISPFISNI